MNDMRKAGKVQDMKTKGNAGEDAVLAIMHKYKLKHGGLLYQSFSYPYASDRQSHVYLGNIFRQENGTFTDITKQGLIDEVDVLYISKYRVFPIEVKSYHAKLEVFDSWFKKSGKQETKSPIAQAEKHARHLYHQLSDVLPNGDPSYIVPIVCFVDRCTVKDSRSPENKHYLPVTILNNLRECITDFDAPGSFGLDLQQIERKLMAIKSDVRKDTQS